MKFFKNKLKLKKDREISLKSLKTFKNQINKLINCSKTNSKKGMLLLLKSQTIKTGMPNKFRFFRFYCYMLKCEKYQEKNKEISYIFKIVTWNDQRWISLQLFKKNKKFPFLTYILENQNEKLYIELLPF